MRLLIIICFLSILTTSCYNTLLPIRIPASSPKIPESNVKKDIPRYSNGRLYKYYKFTKQKQKQLDLSIPEYGVDSLMIRLWFTYPENLYQFGEFLEIRIEPNKEPTARYCKLDIFFNPSREYEVINFHSDTLIKLPLNGWPNLIEKINDLRITELITVDQLSEFQDSTLKNDLFNGTSLTVLIEIATLSDYRFFEYTNFEKYKYIDEVNRMFTFIKLIREELYMYPIDTNWYKE